MSDKVISQRTNTGLLLALTAVVALIFSLLPRLPQPQSYHSFADRRGFLGIPNFGDVVSNVPFGVIGICGLLFLLRSSPGQLKKRFLDSRERWPNGALGTSGQGNRNRGPFRLAYVPAYVRDAPQGETAKT